MRIIFEGKILRDSVLQDVQHAPSETEGKTDAVALQSDEKKIVLKTFDTEQEAITYINQLSDKLIAALESDEIMDAR